MSQMRQSSRLTPQHSAERPNGVALMFPPIDANRYQQHALRTEGGMMLHPASARYRPEPHRAPARTRAMRMRRLADLAGDVALEAPDDVAFRQSFGSAALNVSGGAGGTSAAGR